jgi:hypothetical protein
MAVTKPIRRQSVVLSKSIPTWYIPGDDNPNKTTEFYVYIPFEEHMAQEQKPNLGSFDPLTCASKMESMHLVGTVEAPDFAAAKDEAMKLHYHVYGGGKSQHISAQ